MEFIKLYRHQEEAVKFLERNGLRGYIALPPGLGKTLIASWLIKKYRPKRALIIAPKSSHQVWQKELGRLGVPQNTYRIVTYEKFLNESKNGNGIYFTDFLVLDEAHRIKNIKAKTTRLILKYAGFNIPKILLSGTPFKDIIDLYTQFTLIKPGILGKWKEFTTTYFEKKKNPFGGTEYIPKEELKDEVFEKIAPFFFKKERDEIKELEKIEVIYQFSTPPEYSWEAFKSAVAAEIYRELKGDFSEEVDEEDFIREFAKAIKGKFIQFYRNAQVANKEKHEFIKEFVSDYPDTVVYTYFLDEAEIFSKLIDCYVITGKTDQREREKILKKQDKPVIITSALSEGANLDGYGNLIFSTVPSSPVRFAQVAGRIDRLSQKRNRITYIYLLDEYNLRMFNLLKGRQTEYQLLREILSSLRKRSK